MTIPDTQIVPPAQVSIIPPTDLPNLQNAIVELEHEAAIIPELRVKAKDIVITDASSYAEAGQMLARVREFKKVPDFKLGQFLSRARRVVDWLRTEQNKHVNAAEEIDGVLKAKMAEYKRKETEAAAAEQRRINEERRKQAEADAEYMRKEREAEIKKQVKSGEVSKSVGKRLIAQASADAETAKENIVEVKVKPSVPSVSGVRLTTNYKFRIVDAAKVRAPWRSPDDVLIGQKVRADKNPQKSMDEVGGIECWAE